MTQKDITPCDFGQQVQINFHFLIWRARMSLDKEHLLYNSDAFCILPWIHFHISPGGHVGPCCVGHDEHGSHCFGNYDTESFDELWNGQAFNSFRKNMLADKKQPGCEYCYFMESAGINSFRKRWNKKYEHHFDKVATTKPDGYAPDAKPVYWDIRFSNICNLTCRMCEHTLSSAWHKECQILQEYFIETLPEPIVKGVSDSEKFFREMVPHWDNLEEIYFAGGEPLMMKDHLRTLQKLIEEGRTHVKLLYNTNMTQRYYRGVDIFELWAQFDSVIIQASLDATGKRAEYIRNGCKWDTILKHREELRTVAPNVDFRIYPTVSVFNIHQLTNIHKELVESNFIEIDKFVVSYLLYPEYLNIRILPQVLKDEISGDIREHKKWISERITPEKCDEQLSHWDSILEYLEEDWSDKAEDFVEVTDKLDALRNQAFRKTFPELQPLWELVPTTI